MRPAVVLITNGVLGAAGLAWVLARLGRPALAVLAAGPSVVPLAGFAAVLAAGFAVYALRWRILLRGLDARPGLGRLTAFRAAGQSLSSLVPSGKLGGEPLRAWLLVADGLPAPPAVASVAVDRVLEVTTSTAFACVFAAVLLRAGVPRLGGAFVTVGIGAAALATGVAVAVRRLRGGRGLVTTVVRATGLDRLAAVRGRLDTLAAVDAAAGRLLGEPARLARALAVGAGANLLVLVEYHLLLAALGLPAGPLAVVAALFATGAAHSLPVPAALGVLEGAELWVFTSLGYSAGVGLAVGLAVRLRELALVLPGLLYLLTRGMPPRAAAGL